MLSLLRRLLPQVRLATAWFICLVLAATAVVALVAAEQFQAGAARTAAWAVYFAALAVLAVLAVVTVVLTVSALVSVRSAGGGPSPVPVLAVAVLLLAVFGAIRPPMCCCPCRRPPGPFRTTWSGRPTQRDMWGRALAATSAAMDAGAAK